jgi:hypothetical protein
MRPVRYCVKKSFATSVTVSFTMAGGGGKDDLQEVRRTQWTERRARLRVINMRPPHERPRLPPSRSTNPQSLSTAPYRSAPPPFSLPLPHGLRNVIIALLRRAERVGARGNANTRDTGCPVTSGATGRYRAYHLPGDCS